MNRNYKAIGVLALTAAVAGSCGTYVAFADAGQSYYVCYSTENYRVQNKNKMEKSGNEYLLKDVDLTSLVKFYVTDNAGKRWYAADGDEMTVDIAESRAYDLKFSPDKTYAVKEDGWEDTGCNITYSYHVPADYKVNVGGTPTDLNYNPHHTIYDLYYVSSLYIAGGTVVSFGTERHTVADSGNYRILFTPGERRGGNDYAFNDKGVYGTGDGYEYNLYIEDSPQYFFRPDGESEYRPLTRYEDNVSAAEYRSEEFFVPERDCKLKYCVYVLESGNYRLIDDDNDEDTTVSKITVSDAGWYEFSFADGGSVFTSSCAYKKRNFHGYFIAGKFNGYCYGSDGGVDTDGKYKFELLEEGDDDYDADYDQYELFFTVSEKDLRDGDIEFYITNGDEKYKNGAEYITVSRAGKYRILFSDEHFYGNGRHYRYILQDGETEYTEIEIGSAEEFFAFAEKCSKSADYSKDKAVYLTADIDFSGRNFSSAGNFSGKFYGGYHTLKNITLTKEVPSVFGTVKRDAVVERLKVENLTLSDSKADYAGFIGKNYGTVSGITVYGAVSGNNYVGGAVAYNGRSAENEGTGSTDTNKVYRYGKIIDCKNYADVSGTVHSGGICGFNVGEIERCENFGKTAYIRQSSSSSPFNAGGIAGYSAGKITDCKNNAPVAGGDEALYVGGVCGLCTGEIYYSFNCAAVGGRRYSGGIVGYYGTLSNSNDTKDFFGGLSVEEIYNRYFGDQTDFEQAEGVAHIVKYCKNTGGVSAGAYAGGVCGYTDAAATLTVSCCISSGDVAATAGNYAGGISGYFAGVKLESCFASGIVSAKGMTGGGYVGGIAGYGNNVSSCGTVCVLRGGNNIGGIAGYNQAGLSSCWSNALLSPEKDAEHVGNVAGFTEAFNEGADSFTRGFANNYYVSDSGKNGETQTYYGGNGVFGGIDGTDYARNYGYAAAPVSGEDLAYVGTVSPYLSADFNADGKWQGAGHLSYPVLRCLTEADACDEFNDEAKFRNLFAAHKKEFSDYAETNSKVLFTVTFLEWNEDNGELYDDGELQTDNFDVISVLRIPYGETASAPDFKWAYASYGRHIYDGDEASYFVAFPPSFTVSANRSVYATYREIATTVSTADEKVLAEGLFDKDTVLELVRSVYGYALKFTLNGEEVNVGEVKVKFLPDGKAAGSAVKLYGADGEKDCGFTVSGNYLAFNYADGDYFTVENTGKAGGLPGWAWGLIGGAIGAAVACGGVFGVPAIIKKCKEKRKRGEENNG